VSIDSGSNHIHGKVWEYDRNTILNADGPFAAPVSAVTGKSQKACCTATSLAANLQPLTAQNPPAPSAEKGK
jgi:hypothetical protein